MGGYYYWELWIRPCLQSKIQPRRVREKQPPLLTNAKEHADILNSFKKCYLFIKIYNFFSPLANKISSYQWFTLRNHLNLPKLYLPVKKKKSNMRKDFSINLAVRGRGTGLRLKGGIYHQRRSKHLAPVHTGSRSSSVRAHTHTRTPCQREAVWGAWWGGLREVEEGGPWLEWDLQGQSGWESG